MVISQKIRCKYCSHLQKVKNKEVKCGVCLKQGFLEGEPEKENNETMKENDALVQGVNKQYTESCNNNNNAV
jgi:hypothetical protein